jgi:hypothetical protein
MADTINTDLSQYTIDELFNLFDIKITSYTTYESLTKQIYENGMRMINTFKNKNDKLAIFFEKATNFLLENKSLPIDNFVIQNPNHYRYGEIVSSSNNMNDYMFNGNNGAGNPIHRKTVTKLFNIDSRFRDNYTTTSSTNFTVQLNIEQKNVIEMKLCDLEIPTTFYPISTLLGNNYMWIKFIKDKDDDIKNKYLYVFIPDGNYYFEDLLAYINGINCLKKIDNNTNASIKIDLNYNNGGGVGTGTGKVQFGIFTAADISNNLTSNNYTSIELNFNGSMLYDPNTSMLLKSSVIMNINEMISIYGGNRYAQISNINVQNNFGWILGFKQKFYSGSIDYIAEGVMDILGPRYLFLVIDDGISSSVNTNFFAAAGKGIDSNTIARISLKSPPFNIQTQNDFSVYTEPRYYFGPVTISKFNISLRDEYNRIVDLNKNDMSFTLRLTIVYSD